MRPLAYWAALLTSFFLLAGEASAARSVTLLTPGMRLNLDHAGLCFGECDLKGGKAQWSGMIGELERAGYRFGGVIRSDGSKIELPARLDASPGAGDPRRANLFAMEFSQSADVDGLAYKTLEFAACVRALRDYCGVDKIRVVAYSAGGLAARAYLQSALPHLEYGGEIDRLITIATPHMGSTQAEHWGDFLGTRATALKPSSATIWRLNNELALPADVRFASIIVRGVAIGSTGLQKTEAKTFATFVDEESLQGLPLDFRQGGDQVVGVRSQNLALVRSGRNLEGGSGPPVFYVSARVTDPSPGDWSPFEQTVHEVAPLDPQVILLTRMLIADDAPFWSRIEGADLAKWVSWLAEQHAYGAMEEAMRKRHYLSEVAETEVQQLQLLGAEAERWTFAFEGVSKARWRAPPRFLSVNAFHGRIELEIDAFGRVRRSQHWVKPGRISE